MPTKWMKRFRESGQLTVCNKAGAWTSAVDGAMNTFNNLGLGLKLVAEKDEMEANIIVKMSSGSETYKRYDDTITVNFPAEKMHGKAVTRAHPRLKEIYLAVVFLPGKVQNLTPKQREVVIVHELLHASGLDGGRGDGTQDPGMDHDIIGVMAGQMAIDGDGLIEYLHEKGTKPMTPIRVGAQTMCKMRLLWAGEACQHN